MAAAGFVYPMKDKLEKIEIVTESGCWIWMGASDKDGYGIIAGSHMGVRWRVRAHRASYEFFVGVIPDGKDICHHCDVTTCINPYHLYAGDPMQNTEDMIRRGRNKPVHLTGEQNGMFGRTGALNPFFGKKHSEETKMKISKTKKGIK